VFATIAVAAGGQDVADLVRAPAIERNPVIGLDALGRAAICAVPFVRGE